MTAEHLPAVPDAAAPARPAAPDVLATRVAVLEERTKTRPKTALDQLKDWGGAASLALALMYSFPLGLWDRFIAPEQKRTSEEIARLREVVDLTTVIMTDGAKALSGIQDPSLYDTVGRAISTRLYVLMTKHRPAFEKHKQAFTAPELLVIGLNFTSTGHHDAALAFFDLVEKNAGADVQSRVEALRQRGKIHFMHGPHHDRPAARRLFQAALTNLEKARSQQNMYTHASLTSEWALIELIDGDWTCGQQKLAAARVELIQLAPVMGNDNLARLVEQRTRALQRQPHQTALGCMPEQ